MSREMGQHGDGLGKERLQKAHTQQAPALNILAMGTPVEALGFRVAPLLFYA